MLLIKSLSKSFKDKTILKSITFGVKKGSIACLLGASGAGKSTLLRILSGLEHKDTGTVLLENAPLQQKKVGMVFQQFNLFDHLSVKTNITLAQKLQGISEDDASATADRLLHKYGLLESKDTPTQKLSGGQKQRLALARTLALNPEVVLLDEPTSALDPLLTEDIAGFIQELACDNRIILLSTHDISLVQKLDCHLYFMQNGQIVEHASKHEFANNPSNYPNLSKYKR